MKKTRPIEILSRAEVSALMKTCTRCPSGMRDKALIALLFGAGLRLGEALALLPRDMDMDAGTINVRHGKGDRQRVVGIDDGNLALVQQWMARRKALGARRSAPVICQISKGRVGLPVSQPAVRQMLARRGARAGIDKRLHPHGLRHAHASELAADGLPLHIIQKQLGHRNVATTSRYIDHLRPEEVIAAVRSRASVKPE